MKTRAECLALAAPLNAAARAERDQLCADNGGGHNEELAKRDAARQPGAA